MKHALPFLSGLLIAALAGCGHGSTSFNPAGPPVLEDHPPQAWLPHFTQTELPNKVRLVVNADPAMPLASLTVAIQGSRLREPRLKAGLRLLMAAAMVRATTNLSSDLVAEACDDLGSEIRTDATDDGVLLQMLVMQDRALPALLLLGEVMQNPAFDDGAIADARSHLLSQVAMMDGDAGQTASNVLRARVYPAAHPLSVPSEGTAESLRAITREEVLALHADLVRPENVTVIVAGRVDPAQVSAVAGKVLGRWRPPAVNRPPQAELKPITMGGGRKRVVVIPRPGLVQTEVRVGTLGLPSTDPNQPAVALLLGAVAGHASSYLRRQEGVTYGVGALSHTHRHGGHLEIATAVDAQATRIAVDAILRAFDSVSSIEQFNSNSLALAMTQKLIAESGRARSLVGRTWQAGEYLLAGLAVDHFHKLHEKFGNIGSSQFSELAGRHLDPDRPVIVLVGDPDIIAGQMSGFEIEWLHGH